MVSIGLVLLRVFLRRGIESPEQLEELGITFMPASLFRKHLRKKYSDSETEEKNSYEYESFLAVENPADLAIEGYPWFTYQSAFCDDGGAEQCLMIPGQP
jgi:tyrosine-protein kinase Etk/Wzc